MKKKTFLRGTKKAFCVMLGALMASGSLAGCSSSETTSDGGSGRYELWGAPATEKILQDLHEYDELKTEAKITIDTARNEYEAAQLILTATDEIDGYTVETSDLRLDGGEAVFKKENIAVYNMKYCNITAPWNSEAGRPIGWYPDALLPMDAAVNAGENQVEKGKNQSVYFSFKTPADQPVGTYKGNVKLTVDGKEHVVPVSLRVRNVTVSEAPHHQSMFINNWHYFLGEYDSTQEMFEKYLMMMLEYRIAPTAFVFDYQWEELDAAYYAEKAYEFGSLEKCSNIAIPTSKSEKGIKDEQLTTYILALAAKSMEKNYDLLAKCCLYGIDEPLANNAFDKTRMFAETFRAQVKEAVTQLETKKEENLATYTEIDEAFYDQMIQSIQEIRYITTTRYAENYDPYIDVYCPTFKDFEAGLATGVYDNEDEIWWYGAVGPKNPYPTYHLDDVLLSSRMVGWLQAIYGIEGNIYWGFDIYGDYTGGMWTYRDEYYETDPGHYNNVHGDGYLVYPGKQYGVDGPVPSIRLESIRDGYEEYELLYAIQEQYKALGEAIGIEVSADATIADIASSLYTGTQITATNESFRVAREQILNLSEFTQSGVCFTDYSDDGEGKTQYKVFVPDGVTLETTGVEKLGDEAVTGGKIVTYLADMTKANAASKATFTTEVDGVKVSVTRYLSGAVQKFEADVLAGGFTQGVVAEETKLVNEADVTGELSATGKLVQISIVDAPANNRKQIINFAYDGALSLINANVQKVSLNFWYDGEEELPIKVRVKYKNVVGVAEVSSAPFVFRKGKNSIEWENLSSVNWEKNGGVEYLVFSIEKEGGKARKDLYLRNIAIYHAGGEA